MEITSGKIKCAQKVVIYGVEGIGKSTLASNFPRPIFCDTEGSTKYMDVMRTPKPQSWMQLLEQVKYFIANPSMLETFVIDTADWAESLCIDHVCAKAQKGGIEDFGYGKGYVYVMEEFGRFLNIIEGLISKNVNVVMTAHAKMRKFEQPDELGAYDRWELKLSKQVAPLLKEWTDMLLFCNYKTEVINVDGKGASSGKNKAQGSRRVIYATRHACWDAKNRHGLPQELPMEYSKIAHIFTGINSSDSYKKESDSSNLNLSMQEAANVIDSVSNVSNAIQGAAKSATREQAIKSELDQSIPSDLMALMKEAGVTPQEIQFAVAGKKHYPADTPISNYDPKYIKGVLIGAWPQVIAQIKKDREEMPF